jgi:hypothetical protein
MEESDGKKRKDGPAIFGTFIAIIELAANCTPRGDLLRSGREPHTFESIGRVCRIIPSLIETTIMFCIDPLKWIEIIDLDTNCVISAVTCGGTAECNTIPSSSIQFNSSSVPSSFEKAKFGKRSKTGNHLFKNCIYFDFEKFRAALPDWSELKCRHYYDRAEGYSEQKNQMYHGWIAAVKNWERMDMEKGKPFKEQSQQHPYEKLS